MLKLGRKKKKQNGRRKEMESRKRATKVDLFYCFYLSPVSLFNEKYLFIYLFNSIFTLLFY